ncbi:MAG: DEAD/DEAH box helicase [Verrucomicrobia bacterium]|nr:MAG: DEAD/DEAH box helicase [Verrucomicrobiota bacterium]
MSEFEDLGLAPTLLKAITELGFETPTPVQAQVIPRLLQGERDMVALAQTGTGKTAAFGLPLLQLTDVADAATQALVLCPTRELCLQIAKDLARFSKYTPGVRVVAVYGGAGIDTQMRALRRGAHIIVATPGRLNDLLRRRSAKLAAVRRVVLDEADEMLNMGFQEELETILKDVPDAARTLLFSATMPKQVAVIASKYMEKPEEIQVGQRNAGAEHISHECYIVHARDRYATLKRILDYYGDIYAIVFCRTRIETQEVAAQLMADGYNADALHGELSQPQRDRVMQAFRARKLQLLVATDVAARGLDVNDLTHVINYNLPDVATHYTHRSGRTGRAGKAGISIAIVHMHETYRLGIIERIIKQQFEHKQVPSARDVCQKQLVKLLEQIKQLPADDRRLEPFMAVINAQLGDMTREEMIRRFMLMEFGRTLDYYKNAPDLNARMQHRPASHGAYPHERSERHERGARHERQERGVPESNQPPGEVVRLQINLGHRNGLTPSGLISLINRATPGPKLHLGRIKVMESASVFEMYERDARMLVPEMNQCEVDGRALHVVPVSNFAHGGSIRPSHPARKHEHRPHRTTHHHD